MYSVSTLFNTLVNADGHWFENRVIVNGVTYAQNQIIDMSVELRMFSDQTPAVGGCIAGELTLSLLDPPADIPRMALIQPYVRVTDGTQTSEWVPQGKYYIDTRETTKNDDGLPVMSVHAYDAMLKTETDYPNTTHSWPVSDIYVVNEIASALGVTVDARTTALMDKAYSIGLPAGYSMREVLSNIASMYAGNWVMSYDGELLLIAINGLPAETNYLIDESYNAITFGGDRIHV